jgi:ferredoxin-type protein NapH
MPGSWSRSEVTVAQERTTARRQRVRRTLLYVFLLLFPLTFNYYSPALPVMGSAERIVCFSLLFWLTWMVTSLVLGRAACGYICPLAGLQELWDHSIGRRLVRVRFVRAIKYVIGVAWVGVIVLTAVKADGPDRVVLNYQTPHYVSWDSVQGAFIYVGMFGLVTLLCVPMGKRAFCHYLCWWAPLNIAGTKIKDAAGLPSLRLEAKRARCTRCGTCDRACPMSLAVSTMVAGDALRHTECVLCGSCVDNCPSGAISYTWRRTRASEGERSS